MVRIKDILGQKWELLQDLLAQNKKYYKEYFQKAARALLEIFLLLLIVYCVTSGFLYGVKAFWFFYASTPMGHEFAWRFPDRALIMQNMSLQNPFALALPLVLTALSSSMFVATIGKLFHFIGLFYRARGLFFRGMFWGIPLTLFVAARIHHAGMVENGKAALIMAVIPTLTVFPACFRFAESLLPEIRINIKSRYRERDPRKTLTILSLSLISGFAAFLLYSAAIHPLWQDTGWLHIITPFFHKFNLGMDIQLTISALFSFFPFWLGAVFLGLSLGVVVVPPWLKIALFCCGGYVVLPFFSGHLPWETETVRQWLIIAGLHFFAVPCLLLSAWFAQRTFHYRITYDPYQAIDENPVPQSE